MTEDIYEIKLKIRAVEFVLGSYAKYEDNEKDRKNYLRQHFKTHQPALETYYRYSEQELKDALNKQQDLLLAQQRGIKIILLTSLINSIHPITFTIFY